MTSLPRTVGTIGGGNMAEAILQGLVQAGYEASQLLASDPLPDVPLYSSPSSAR